MEMMAVDAWGFFFFFFGNILSNFYPILFGTNHTVHYDGYPKCILGAACQSAEKVLADTRKAYCNGTRQGILVVPTLDKAQAAKIQEQENLLRASVNKGDALRLPVDQRQNPPALPMHLVDVLSDGGQAFFDAFGMYLKNTPVSSSNLSAQSPLMQSKEECHDLIKLATPHMAKRQLLSVARMRREDIFQKFRTAKSRLGAPIQRRARDVGFGTKVLNLSSFILFMSRTLFMSRYFGSEGSERFGA